MRKPRRDPGWLHWSNQRWAVLRVLAIGRYASTSLAAERHFNRGLKLAGQDEDLRLSLLPGWAEALLLRGHFRDSAAACREAIASHESRGDKAQGGR